MGGTSELRAMLLSSVRACVVDSCLGGLLFLMPIRRSDTISFGQPWGGMHNSGRIAAFETKTGGVLIFVGFSGQRHRGKWHDV